MELERGAARIDLTTYHKGCEWLCRCIALLLVFFSEKIVTSDGKLRPGTNKVLGCIPFDFYWYCFLNDFVGHALACGWAVSFPELVSGCPE